MRVETETAAEREAADHKPITDNLAAVTTDSTSDLCPAATSLTQPLYSVDTEHKSHQSHVSHHLSGLLQSVQCSTRSKLESPHHGCMSPHSSVALNNA